MEENKQDVMIRAYATLSALRKNIDPIAYGVTEVYVREFHNSLDRLETVGIDVLEFRIPESVVKPRITSTHRDGGRSYSDEKYVDKPYLLTKIDAILGYFEIITAEKPKTIGFHKPDNQ